MTRPLTLNETLEGKISTLKEMLKRPVYIVGEDCYNIGRDTKYKTPKSKTYRPMGDLDVFLSGYEGTGKCVGKSEDGYRLFDLKPANRIKLVYPIKKEDAFRSESGYPYAFNSSVFKSVGLLSSTVPQIIQTEGSKIPKDLEPFVLTYKFRGIGNPTSGVNFAVSEAIYMPLKSEYMWREGDRLPQMCEDPVYGKVTPLYPPGKYNNEKLSYLDNFNQFGVAECDPGPCVMCRGQSGKRRHFIVTDVIPGHMYPTNHVCSKCVKSMFSQIQDILGED